MDLSTRALMAVLMCGPVRPKEADDRLRLRIAQGVCTNRFEMPDGTEADCEEKTKIVVGGRTVVIGRRGLCPRCYREFLNALAVGTQVDALEYERRVVRLGLVAAFGERREIGDGRKSKLRPKRKRA